MKKYAFAILFGLIALMLSPVLSHGQSVKVSGEVTTPLDLKPADIQQMPRTDVVRPDRDGKPHTYTGVVLATILQKAGATLGKDLRGENLAKYVWVEAADGYQVVFALAELDKDFTDRTIILADTVDGKPLATGDGPFRIIVQDEKKPARCIKQVTAVKVMFAK